MVGREFQFKKKEKNKKKHDILMGRVRKEKEKHGKTRWPKGVE